MSKYYEVLMQAKAIIEKLGYTFPDELLIVKYQGRNKKVCGEARYLNKKAAIIEVNLKAHKDSADLENTIYHELAHVTHECANNEHGKKWQKLAALITEKTNIVIEEFA